MNPDRFLEAKRIYASALEQEPAERDAYLREACRGDEALQQEVASLLSCRTDAQEFFKTSEAQTAARASGLDSHTDFTGRTLSHYAIVAKIGEGGMGVVYRARDTHLDRFVALKVLPPEKVADPERRRRFILEAKAASALNHPNIVTIHDIDTADGVTFIVMEYVRGTTLAQVIRAGRALSQQTLTHGVQIADALSAAHAAGIVHRDVKPANLMVTDSGLVKVLDFGLAKLTEPGEMRDGAAVAADAPRTDDGLILGTVAYMSPEQAAGKDVDARSDIFSLGAVLYEMATGQRAFMGETHASTLAAILRDEPKPVNELAPEAEPGLGPIISRCLQKDPERRFQHMTDVKAALEQLNVQSHSGSPPAMALRAARGHPGLVGAAASLLLATALGAGAWWGVFKRPAAGPIPTVSALTALPGTQSEPAMSADGKQVAFVWNGDVYVQLVNDATPRQLTNSAERESSPVWSPDALYIAFSRATASGTEVIVIPSAGGAERRLLVSTAWCSVVWAKQYCGPAWSPGGRYLTLVDRDSPKAPNSIFLFDIETRQKRKLTAPPRGFEDGLSVFSPDGRTLAFVRRPGWPLWDIYLLSLTEDCQPRGDPVQVTRDHTFIFGMDWAADGRSIVFGSSRGGVYALWRVASSGGAPDRVAVGGNDAFWPSIASKGSRLAFSYGNTNMHVWQTAAPGADRSAETATAPRRVSHSPMWDQQPAFSPDGQQIAWSSTHSGSHQIWVSGSGGARPRQLTHLEIPGADSPQWSPDGRTIAFRGFTPGPTPELYVIATEGGAPRRLTSNTSGVSVPNWSHDGGWLYFASDRGDGPVIWRVPARGGSPVPVARGWWPVESLDGKVIYSATVEEGVWKSAAGGKAPVLLARNGLPPIFESPDGAFVYYTGRDASIWRVPTNGGNAAVVQNLGKRAIWTVSKRGIYVLDPDAAGGPVIEFTPFVGSREVVRLPGEAASYIEPSGKAAGLAASPDGRWLVYLHREYTDTKIMLVENFR